MIGKKINQLATELAPASTDLTIIGNPTTGVSKKITLAQLGAIFSGAVSFYTNYAAFPTPGTTDVIYCAKDTQKLYLWSGSAYVEVFPSQALLDTYQLRSEKGNANGYASLDSSGKVPISQLPSSIMEYKGTWSAATNTPTLANGTGDTGDVYICNAAGSVNFGAGAITFAVGDYVIYSGSIWQRSSGAVGTVTSVAASITGNAIGITGSPVTTSGTLAFAFAGTGTQYIKGDGTLATFPSTISQAERLITEVYNSTGATLTKGTVVYINGGQGNLPTVTKALATGDSTSAQTFGIVQADITNNNNGYVVVAGKLNDLDTQAYTEGTQLYLSSTTAGAWTSTKQYAPAHLVYVGIVVRSHPTQGVVEVKIQNGYELDEIHNVAAQTPSNNDGLFYESSTSLWKNKSISTILGGTPITGSGNVNAIPKFTANSVLGNSVMEDDGNFVSMRGLKLNVVAGSGSSINLGQASSISAAGLGYSTIGASGTAGFIFYIDQNTTQRSFIIDVNNINSATTRNYSMPNASGTFALTSDLTGGTVTSVGLSSATSGVTIGSTPITTSGTITLAIATASGSQQGLLSSTDWTTFNNKQNALTNPVTGTGTTNYLPKFTGTSTIGNSNLQDDGTNILTSLAYKSTANSNTFGNASASGRALIIQSGSANQAIMFKNAAGGDATLYVTGTSTSVNYQFDTYSVGGALTLTNSGNLGLGVTPSAWFANTLAAEVGPVALYSRTDIVNDAGLMLNAYRNTSASYIYKQTGFATFYQQGNGSHYWFNAPSGTAGNAISFTQAMTLNASGNLSIGNTNDTYKLDVSGTGRFTGSVTAGSLLRVIEGGYNRFFEVSESTIKLYGGGDPSIKFGDYNTGVDKTATIGFEDDYFGRGALSFRVKGQASGTGITALTLASTGAATFSSSVTTGSPISIKSTAPFIQWLNDSSTRLGYIQHNATNLVYNADTGIHVFNQAATFSSSVTATSGTFITGSQNSTGVYIGANNSWTSGSEARLDFGGLSGNLGRIANYYSGSGLLWGLKFYTTNSSLNTTPALTLTGDNNVGIGTTSPAATLSVRGDNGNSVSAVLRIRDTNSTARTTRIQFEDYAGAYADGLIDFKIPTAGTASGARLDLGVDSAIISLVRGGNVGIGTTSPATILHLVQSSGPTIRLVRTSNRFDISADNDFMELNARDASTYMTFKTADTERMRIKSNGIINLSNVPSSSAGLSSGDIYKTVAGVLMIV